MAKNSFEEDVLQAIAVGDIADAESLLAAAMECGTGPTHLLGIQGEPVGVATVFDGLAGFTSPATRRHFDQFLEIVAAPGAVLMDQVRPGDILLERALGEGGLAFAKLVTRADIAEIDGNDLGRRNGDSFFPLPSTRRRPQSLQGRLGHNRLIVRSRGSRRFLGDMEEEVWIDGRFDQSPDSSEKATLQYITHAGIYRLVYDRLTTLGVIEPLPGRNTRRFRGTAALQIALNNWAPYIQTIMAPPRFILTGGLYVNKPGEHGNGNAIDVDGFWWASTDKFLANDATTDWVRYLTIEATLRKVFGTVLNYDYNTAHHDHWHCDLGRSTTWRAVKSQAKFAQRALKEIWGESLKVDGKWGDLSSAAATKNGFNFSTGGGWYHFLDTIINRQSIPESAPPHNPSTDMGIEGNSWKNGKTLYPSPKGELVEEGSTGTKVYSFDSNSSAEQIGGVNWCRIRRRISCIALVEEARWSHPNGTKRLENETVMVPVLESYWRTVPGINPIITAQESANNTRAWSAAFICFVMQTAGVESMHGFEFGQRHMTYIVGALRNRERSDRNRPFWLYDSRELEHDATPGIGDLLCFNRLDGGAMTSHSYDSLRRQWWSNNQGADPRGSSHCSLVVDIISRGSRRFIQTVGGNESAPGLGPRGWTVRLREIEINQNGAIMNPNAIHVFGIIKILDCPNLA